MQEEKVCEKWCKSEDTGYTVRIIGWTCGAMALAEV